MLEPAMYQPVLAWVGFAVLLLLCLPFSGTRKLVLEVYAWVVRLALLAVLLGGAVLWFRPDLLPAEVVGAVDTVPELRGILPASGSQLFGLALAAVVAAVLLPLLAVLDVTRKLAGDRLRRLRRLTAPVRTEPAAVVEQPVVERPARPRPVVQHRPDRRAAADTMADLGARKPVRVSDHLS